MVENIELLQEIYKMSEIGYYATNKILNNIKGCKSDIKKVLINERKNYKEYKDISSDYLDNYDVKIEKVPFLTKLSCGIEINKKITCEDLDDIPKILLKIISKNINFLISKKEVIKNYDKDVIELFNNIYQFELNEQQLLKTY